MFSQWLFFLLLQALLHLRTYGGLQAPPGNIHDALFGPPCDCQGGDLGSPPSTYSLSIDCVSKTAYLKYTISQAGLGTSRQRWVCVPKPRGYDAPPILPSLNNSLPGTCPTECSTIHDNVHSACYYKVYTCSKGGQTYFTARIQKNGSTFQCP